MPCCLSVSGSSAQQGLAAQVGDDGEVMSRMSIIEENDRGEKYSPL